MARKKKKTRSRAAASSSSSSSSSSSEQSQSSSDLSNPTIPNGLKALEAACRGPHRGVRKTPSQSMLASLMPMLLATGRNCRNWFIFFSTTGTAKSKKGIPWHLSSFASSSVKGWKSLASAACHGQHAALTKIFILKLTHTQLLVVLK